MLERGLGFLTYAKQFLEAASVIAACKPVSRTRIAVTYLYGHAIELALKSILVKNDVLPEEKLGNQIGHNLEKALEMANLCPEKAFLDKKLEEIISILNPEYGKKHLEYHPGTRGMRLPCATNMQETVGKLIRQLDSKYRECLRGEKRKRS